MNYKGLFSCEDKVALVTGGAGLLGREIAKALYDFGARVYIGDADEKKAKEISGDTGIGYVHLDITSEDSIEKAMETVISDNGGLDIMVNSAYPRTKDWGNKIEKVSLESWKNNVDSHLGGYFFCCRKAAEQMKQQGGGTIINLASIYGVVAPDFSIYEGTKMTMPVAYSAIKGGIIALTRYIATYYAKYNVRANTVSPGGIFDNQQEAFVKRYSDKTPLGRMGSPSEVTGAVVFLASEAASYVTGQNLIVDGGWTAW
ncbi:MAG: short-chain dehydrogenase/reductase SDR [Nitrospirae bacterium]|nr:MAG: short-chain dehydrogenase/reductase SDR [Nitrospirota bacterium]